MKSLFHLLLLGRFAAYVADGFAVCGDPSHRQEVDAATEEILKLFMGYRNPDWGWASFTTAIALQVTVPERFFGREKTARALEERVKSQAHSMSVNAKAVYAIAARSLCLNERDVGGIDLIQSILDHLDQQFPNNSRTPRDGFVEVSIGLSALCVGRYPIKASFVEKLLGGQNKDGSFGTRNRLATTVKLLPPMHCLMNLPKPTYDLKKLQTAVVKMREYVISHVVSNDAGDVYIGNKLLTSFALLGLWNTKNATDDPARWRCSEAVMTLGLYPDPGESEYLLIWRLLRLHGAVFVDVGKPGYKCVKTDPVPEGYVPTCLTHQSHTCEPMPDPK